MSKDGWADKALHFIAGQQLKSGGFESVSLPFRAADSKSSNAYVYQTTFMPSLILGALSGIKATDIRGKIVQYLLGQKSGEWSFNYWDRSSSQYETMPYPDDLDDTFCTLAALTSADASVISPTVLASVAQLLMANEVEPGGPYRTWLTDSQESIWQDVDVAVNANIARFLAMHDVLLPPLQAFLETALTNGSFTSPYYPDAYPLYYFIASWYQGELVPVLQRQILTGRVGGDWQCPQRTALSVTALLKLGYDPSRLSGAVDAIKMAQQADGGWFAEGFCFDPSQAGKQYVASSRTLTTALCIEAITLFGAKQKTAKRLQTKRNSDSQSVAKDELYEQVVEAVEEDISGVTQSDLQTGLRQILKTILSQDKDRQIVLLPQLVSKAAGVDPPDEVTTSLAIVSLWGWMAYTTYDDVLDGEGDLRLLPAANVCLRNLTQQLSAVLPECQPFHAEVDEIMVRLDAANAWEMARCRGVWEGEILIIDSLPDYGDYWQLADRSLGHTISGLGILYACDVKDISATTQAYHEFFKHYLIARQLNDDAHDWYDDLLQGHVNAVAAEILKYAAATKRAKKNKLRIELAADKARLQQIMWSEVIDLVCRDIDHHIKKARQALKRPDSGLQIGVLESLLLPIEQATKLALEKRNEAQAFIAALDV